MRTIFAVIALTATLFGGGSALRDGAVSVNSEIAQQPYRPAPGQHLFLVTEGGVSVYDLAHLNRAPALIECRNCDLSAANANATAVLEEWDVSSRLVKYDLRRNKRVLRQQIDDMTWLGWSRGRVIVTNHSSVRLLGNSFRIAKSVESSPIFGFAIGADGRIALATKGSVRVLDSNLRPAGRIRVSSAHLGFDQHGNLFVADEPLGQIKVYDHLVRSVATQSLPRGIKFIGQVLPTSRGIYITASESGGCIDGNMALYRIWRDKKPEAVLNNLNHIDALLFDARGDLALSESSCSGLGPASTLHTTVYSPEGRPIIRLTGTGKVNSGFIF